MAMGRGGGRGYTLDCSKGQARRGCPKIEGGAFMRSVKFMRAAKTSYIVLSALYCVFGVLLIAVPDFSMKLLGILVGCMMIGFGAVKLMGYFSRDLYRLAFQFDLAYGILLIVLGLIVLVRPVQLVSFFCLVLGICILADGLFKIQAASDSKRFGLRPWWLILTLAIMACLAGLLLVFRPMDNSPLRSTMRSSGCSKSLNLSTKSGKRCKKAVSKLS